MDTFDAFKSEGTFGSARVCIWSANILTLYVFTLSFSVNNALIRVLLLKKRGTTKLIQLLHVLNTETLKERSKCKTIGPLLNTKYNKNTGTKSKTIAAYPKDKTQPKTEDSS